MKLNWFFLLMGLCAVACGTFVDVVENIFAHFWPVEVFFSKFKGGVGGLMHFMQLLDVVCAKCCWYNNFCTSKHNTVFYSQLVSEAAIGL